MSFVALLRKSWRDPPLSATLEKNVQWRRLIPAGHEPARAARGIPEGEPGPGTARTLCRQGHRFRQPSVLLRAQVSSPEPSASFQDSLRAVPPDAACCTKLGQAWHWLVYLGWQGAMTHLLCPSLFLPAQSPAAASCRRRGRGARGDERFRSCRAPTGSDQSREGR